MNRNLWKAAMTKYEALRAESETASAIYSAAYKAYEAEAPSIEMIPFARFPYMHKNWVARVMNIDAVQEKMLSEAHVSGEAQAATIAAFDAVREYRRLDAECEDRHDIGELGGRSDRLCDSLNDALGELIALPAPGLPELLWKLETTFVERPDQDTTPPMDMGYVQPIFDDARRLLSEPTPWAEALADYEAKTAHAESLADNHPDCDRAVEARCAAMDHLVENVSAPNLHALAYKISLVDDRWEGFETPKAWLDAFVRDAIALDWGTC